MPAVGLILSITGWFFMFSATPFNTSLIFLAFIFTLTGFIFGFICLFNPNYQKIFSIVGIAICIISLSMKSDLDNKREASQTYYMPSTSQNYSVGSSTTTQTPATVNPTPSTVKPTPAPVKPTPTPITPTYKPATPKIKNYQQIYNEYSQKLINAGPTSSITEMAEICNEGVIKMAEYMYSAKGTDGQYATYQSWASKLYDVYINNCR